MEKAKPDALAVGVVGAGTMGAGIALMALLGDAEVILQDVSSEALARARAYVEKYLAKKDRLGNLERLRLVEDLEEMAEVDVVIEAAPEDLALKRAIFQRLEEVCPTSTILATNTSTLLVTAIAAATKNPQRVAGMHFFNPAAVLPLVEVVRGAETSEDVLSRLSDLAEAWGKTAVVVNDRAGFIVNRVARPFYGEALRLLGEGVASHEEIDAVMQLGGGFRMGLFRLMDLIGIDVNAAAAQSMYEQSFGEPRYRPHWMQMQKVSQGTLGRKSGRGFYVYDEGEAGVEAQEAPQMGKGHGRVVISAGSWAAGLGDLCAQAGYSVERQPHEGEKPEMAVVVAGRSDGLQEMVTAYDGKLPPDAPLLVQSADATVAEMATWTAHPERLVGLDGLFFASGRAATLVPSPKTNEQTIKAVDSFVRTLGRLPVWIKDSAGLILPRVVSMLVNEAAFATLEGVGDADTIDKAMRLGVNYPQGPLAWGKALGYGRVVAVLDHLRAEYGEERYRACSLLRRWARMEALEGRVKREV